MNEERVKNVLARLHDLGASQMIVTEPVAVYWLSGKMIEPGERFLGLYLHADEKPVLFVNRLFPCEEDGFDIVWYSDGDDVIGLLKKTVHEDEVLGVDKNMAAVFLLPLFERHAAAGIINGSKAVDAARAVKDETELEYLRTASRINDAAMARFKALVHEGVTEREVADQTAAIYKELGGESFSFPPIVSFGANAADPHHMPDDTVVKEGDCVLFDVGCKFHGYCSDMTRTFYFKKAPDERVANIYNLVRRANEDAEKAEHAGMKRSDIDAIARSIITTGGYGPQFNHRLGHFIGLTDHEKGDISMADHAVLEVNNVHSIEPGIYLAGDTGVRIEDLVIVTEDGVEVLNRYPKGIEVID